MLLTLTLIPQEITQKDSIHHGSTYNTKHLLLFNDFLADSGIPYLNIDPINTILELGYVIILTYGNDTILTWIPKTFTESQFNILKAYYNYYCQFINMEYSIQKLDNTFIHKDYQKLNPESLNIFYQEIEEYLKNQNHKLVRTKDTKEE